MKGLRIIVVLLAWLALAQSAFAGTLVEFQIFLGVNSYLGEVDLELYDHDKPVTVNNFVRLVQAGAFQAGFFHRCVPGFIVQAGGYSAYNPYLTNIMVYPYTNLYSEINFGEITNEFNVGKFYSNTNWTMAMAKTSDPNSATSEFFFNLANNSSSLDSTNNSGGFTVFGSVVRGTNVLNNFNTFYQGYGIENMESIYGTNSLNSLFTQLPVNEIGTNAPPYDQLAYFNVSVLTAQISINKTNGARQISWNSISGVTNNVEYATNLTSAWNVLVSTNGDGSTFTVTDTTTNKSGRFYRVHVLF